jgi:hypothetical protein
MMNTDQFSFEGGNNSESASIYPLMDYDQPTQYDSLSPLGKPCEKPLVSLTHASAAVTSLICLLLGTLSIIPNLPIAWRLEFTGQIVVVGFLLAVMNLCMQTVLPYTFLLLEARFGQSGLQTFEAIITGKILSPRTTLGWRLVLLLLTALPLGLSVAYKRFLGGTSRAEVMLPLKYGIDFPRIADWAPPDDPIYFLTSSIGAFLAASQYSSEYQRYPSTNEFPKAYGYNTLLLSGDSAAILDTPTALNISSTQTLLSEGERLDINASVNAYMATVDESSDFRTNDTTWYEAITSSQDGLSTMYLYEGQGAQVGMMTYDANDQAYFGLYYNSSATGGMSFYQNADEDDFAYFRLSARKYRLTRAQCYGQWLLNASSITLVGGDCPVNHMANSSILQGPGLAPFAYDALPTAQHIFGAFATSPEQANPAWLNATCSVFVITMYWARGLYMLNEPGGQSSYSDYYSGPDQPRNQTIVSTRITLYSSKLLFLVLATQPIITLAALAVTIWLYDIPLGSGFGIVSILSGFDPSRSRSIAGAGLSGELTAPVKLEVAPTKSIGGDSLQAVDDTQVTYRLLGISKSRERKRLQRGRMYW